MKVFVTGAGGFIGKHFIVTARRMGCEVKCLVHEASTTNGDLEHLKHHGCSIVFGDITSPADRLLLHAKGCDKIVHLAGFYSFNANEEKLERINATGAINIAKVALLLNIPLIHFSTVATVGTQPRNVMFDESVQFVDHICAYGRTKSKGDDFIRGLRDNHGLKVTILKPGAQFGSGDNQASARYVKNATNAGWPSGTGMPGQLALGAIHTWTHVHDTVDAIATCLTSNDTLGQEYLIGGHRLKFKDLNRIIEQVWQKKRPRWNPEITEGWLLLICAFTIAPYYKWRGIEPRWGLTPDAVRVMKQGFCFSGEKAQRELLHSKPYRPIQDALLDFKNGRCSICNN